MQILIGRLVYFLLQAAHLSHLSMLMSTVSSTGLQARVGWPAGWQPEAGSTASSATALASTCPLGVKLHTEKRRARSTSAMGLCLFVPHSLRLSLSVTAVLARSWALPEVGGFL